MLDAPKIYLRNPRHPRLKPGLGFLPNEPKRAARRFKVSSSRFKVCRKIRNEPILSLTPALSRPTGEGVAWDAMENYQTNPSRGAPVQRFGFKVQSSANTEVLWIAAVTQKLPNEAKRSEGGKEKGGDVHGNLPNEPTSLGIADFRISDFRLYPEGGHRPPLQRNEPNPTFVSFVCFCSNGPRGNRYTVPKVSSRQRRWP